jgi:hypothetical protein
MDRFAKLFETEDRGQLLVLLKTDENGNPEVRFFAQPESLGVCSVAIGWEDDSERSWSLAEKAFEKTDEAIAREATNAIFRLVEEEG